MRLHFHRSVTRVTRQAKKFAPDTAPSKNGRTPLGAIPGVDNLLCMGVAISAMPPQLGGQHLPPPRPHSHGVSDCASVDLFHFSHEFAQKNRNTILTHDVSFPKEFGGIGRPLNPTRARLISDGARSYAAGYGGWSLRLPAVYKRGSVTRGSEVPRAQCSGTDCAGTQFCERRLSFRNLAHE